MGSTPRVVVFSLLLLFGAACPAPHAVDPDAGLPEDASVGPDAGPRTDPITPEGGAFSYEDLDCTTAWTAPAELTGSDGLGSFGWSWDSLRFTLAWNFPNRFVNRWISSNDDAVPSARVHPQLVPATGYCFEHGLASLQPTASESGAFLADLVRQISPFARRDTGLNAMQRLRYTPPGYDLSGGNALARALEGLATLPNALPGGPVVSAWSDQTRADVLQITQAYPEPVQHALADLVLATGEAYLLKQYAIAGADVQVLQRIHQQFRAESYATGQSAHLSPSGGTVVSDLIAQADKVELGGFVAAAERLGQAADEVRAAFAASGPIDAPELKVVTPHGLVWIRTAAHDDVYAAGDLYGVTLLVDAGGDDQYGPGVAAASDFWMSSAVVLDLAGNDRYGPQTPDIESPTATAAEVFSNEHGFSQGAGLFSVGLLVDGAGDDDYRASVYSQGVGTFGVGVLADLGGTDVYRLGHMGQGAGFFGVGALVDVAGNDRYRIYSVGQGAGKPGGVGVLLDLAGDDDYLGYNEENGPELPGSGVQNYYQLDPKTWPYNDGTKAHFMSVCQGVGWGYRADWLQPNVNWMGGFGALVDLGGGKDSHTADTFSMGQGFVYGFGFLYDDGGDDRYRTFWWGPAAAAHMGIGLFVDEAGNDDLYTTRASAGFGYDSSVAWLIDRGGNDRYGGQIHYGEAYTYGLSFFLNEGGDDTYNAGGALAKPIFGGVNQGYQGVNLLGAFLDLGGGADTYVNAPPEVGNDTVWHLAPVNPLAGQSLDPAHHKGIGIDR